MKAAYDWDEQTHQTNMAQLNNDSRSYIWSSYDPKSIMKYYFSPTLLQKGRDSKCYTGENYQLSERDIEGLRMAYPMSAPPLSNTQTRDALVTISGSQMPQAATDLARELAKLRR